MTDEATEQRRNGFDDDDLKMIVDEIEGYEADKRTARSEAAGKCSQLSEKIKKAKKRGKELHIPTEALNGLLKTRKLQRDLDEAAENVPDEFAEVYEDMVKVLGAFGDTPLGQSALAAAQKRSKAAEDHHEAEQAEGAAALSELAGTAH